MKIAALAYGGSFISLLVLDAI